MDTKWKPSCNGQSGDQTKTFARKAPKQTPCTQICNTHHVSRETWSKICIPSIFVMFFLITKSLVLRAKKNNVLLKRDYLLNFASFDFFPENIVLPQRNLFSKMLRWSNKTNEFEKKQEILESNASRDRKETNQTLHPWCAWRLSGNIIKTEFIWELYLITIPPRNLPRNRFPGGE